MLAKPRSTKQDAHIGLRIRLRRQQLKISQIKLSDELGVSYQQIQKYEKGMNRVSASRLQQIAKMLEVPISFFYEAAEGAYAENRDVLGFLENAYAFRLIQAFSHIRDKNLQMSVLTLVEQIAGPKKS